mmetsp:Transcript_56028/g.128600  ORF Transcript_56028/g.128600 Transcript_56028/m.128600 type:complete len:269 (+) Transcript_56028:674-1480(+)
MVAAASAAAARWTADQYSWVHRACSLAWCCRAYSSLPSTPASCRKTSPCIRSSLTTDSVDSCSRRSVTSYRWRQACASAASASRSAAATALWASCSPQVTARVRSWCLSPSRSVVEEAAAAWVCRRLADVVASRDCTSAFSRALTSKDTSAALCLPLHTIISASSRWHLLLQCCCSAARSKWLSASSSRTASNSLISSPRSWAVPTAMASTSWRAAVSSPIKLGWSTELPAWVAELMLGLGRGPARKAVQDSWAVSDALSLPGDTPEA